MRFNHRTAEARWRKADAAPLHGRLALLVSEDPGGDTPQVHGPHGTLYAIPLDGDTEARPAARADSYDHLRVLAWSTALYVIAVTALGGSIALAVWRGC